MKKSFTLTMATPCSEKWETFRQTKSGAFCSSCSKEVIDFTSLTDQQIIDFFKSQNNNTCGRFRPEQLTRYHFAQDSINPGWKLWRAGLVALVIALVGKPSFGQSAKPVSIERVQHESQDENEQVIVSHNYIEVTGVVTSLDDGMPLPGVMVQKSGTTLSTSTDAEGRFKFPGQLKQGESIDFMFIGLKSQTQLISGSSNLTMSVQMETDATQLGGYMVGGITRTRTISFRRWWWKLKSIF